MSSKKAIVIAVISFVAGILGLILFSKVMLWHSAYKAVLEYNAQAAAAQKAAVK